MLKQINYPWPDSFGYRNEDGIRRLDYDPPKEYLLGGYGQKLDEAPRYHDEDTNTDWYDIMGHCWDLPRFETGDSDDPLFPNCNYDEHFRFLRAEFEAKILWCKQTKEVGMYITPIPQFTTDLAPCCSSTTQECPKCGHQF